MHESAIHTTRASRRCNMDLLSTPLVWVEDISMIVSVLLDIPLLHVFRLCMFRLWGENMGLGVIITKDFLFSFLKYFSTWNFLGHLTFCEWWCFSLWTFFWKKRRLPFLGGYQPGSAGYHPGIITWTSCTENLRIYQFKWYLNWYPDPQFSLKISRENCVETSF